MFFFFGIVIVYLDVFIKPSCDDRMVIIGGAYVEVVGIEIIFVYLFVCHFCDDVWRAFVDLV